MWFWSWIGIIDSITTPNPNVEVQQCDGDFEAYFLPLRRMTTKREKWKKYKGSAVSLTEDITTAAKDGQWAYRCCCRVDPWLGNWDVVRNNGSNVETTHNTHVTAETVNTYYAYAQIYLWTRLVLYRRPEEERVGTVYIYIYWRPEEERRGRNIIHHSTSIYDLCAPSWKVKKRIPRPSKVVCFGNFRQIDTCRAPFVDFRLCERDPYLFGRKA